MAETKAAGTCRRHFRVKTPPPSSSDIFDFSRFREYVELLETSQDLILSQRPVKARIALIVLDNLAEVLMAHRCREMFEHDDFTRKFLRQRFSRSDREKVRRDFNGKVRFLVRNGILKEADSTILRIGHSFRNAGFHEDQHNDQANATIVRLLFHAASNVFVTCYGPGELWGQRTIGGNPEIERWARSKGLATSYLEFGSAADKISRRLIQKIKLGTPVVAHALTKDLNERWKRLIVSVLSELPVPELVLDEILKTEEFEAVFDEDSIAEPLWEMQRQLAERKDFDRDAFVQLEHDVTVKLRAAYDSFRTELNWRKVVGLQRQIRGLADRKSPDSIFMRYEEINDALAKAEHLLNTAIRKNEAAADLAADIAREK